jgi:parvulin-like peptidyl-prolyl isomerase
MDASTTQIDKMMAQYPGFMENGEFSERKYNATSSSEKYNLRKLMRETVIHEQYIEDILSNVLVGSEEISFVKSISKKERKFQFIAYRYDQFPREEVVTYGEANRKKFEQAQLSVITINSSEADAENILEQLKNRTSSFESLARNHSEDIYADQGGDAGLKYYYELERDFTNPSLLDGVFDLNPGEVSDVLETTYGWVIYRLDEAPIEPDFSRDEMRETVRNYMFSFERGLVEDYLISQSEDFIAQANETGFQQAADNAGLTVYNTGFFPINYGNSQFLSPVNSNGFPEIADAAFNMDFFRQGFGLNSGELSEPIIQRDYIVVLSLLEERRAEESTAEFLDFYYPVIARQFTARDIERFYLNSDKLEDNFDTVFFEQILGR